MRHFGVFISLLPFTAKAMTTSLSSDKKILRAILRQRRRQLSSDDQFRAATALSENASHIPAFCNAQRIALYIANDGEINPSFLINALWQQGKQVYLPVLPSDHSRNMRFRPVNQDTSFITNRYGIPEPASTSDEISPSELDMVFLPLVGFDSAGRRLGMGGGFYDATFAFKQEGFYSSPQLIGLAHACQEVDELISDSWDIPLSGILTDRGYFPTNEQ